MEKVMLILREIEIFHPYKDEFPEVLLVDAAATEACLDQWRNAEILRIAKRGEEILGCYAMTRLSENEFRLFGVTVQHNVRKQGLGRWVVGHAIGVAESKGAREISIENIGSSRCLGRIGFERGDGKWTFSMIQE
ncbi:MAG: N-acetylglutamate synthase-like GNAT family acetyltransferase [Limisphaerales bacterium]